MKSLEQFVKENDYFVVAHRGSSGTAPENTLAAFRAAMSAGADMIEVDIQITRDNEIIAHHDFYPEGLDQKVSELDFNDIKKIDIGSGFDTRFAGEKVPTLEQILDLIYSKCYLMIEIKTLTGEKFMENAEKLIRIIKKYGYEDKTLFGSFNYKALKHLKEIDPKLRTAAIKIPGEETLPSELKQVCGCEVFICSVEEMNPEIAADAEKNCIYTGVYSVDTRAHVETARQYKVTAFATDYPEKIINLLRNPG
jgi:glycerophosphoryl diester phosphodiesterase